jgi:hypothetical protein
MIKFIHYQPSKDAEVMKLPVRPAYKTMKLMKEKSGLIIGLDDDGTNYDAYETLLFYALQVGYKWEEGKDSPWKQEDMVDIMDQCFNEFMGMLPEFFGEKEDPNTAKKIVRKDRVVEEKK